MRKSPLQSLTTRISDPGQHRNAPEDLEFDSLAPVPDEKRVLRLAIATTTTSGGRVGEPVFARKCL